MNMMLSIFKRKPAQKAVAILDADAPPGLAFTRSLGRQGVPVYVYSPKRYPVSRLSRYCSHFAHCPDPEDVEAFLPWLKNEVAKNEIAYVAPTSDLLAFYMAEFPEVFPAEQQSVMPSRDAVLNMLFKDRFDASCKKHGVRVPWTIFPSSIDEALAEASSLPYPLILKPKSHVGVGWARGVVVHNEQELRKAYLPYPVHPKRRMIMERFGELAWPMLQEYIPEALKHLYSISGLFDKQGDLVVWAGSRKTLQWPPTLGVGVVFEPWHQEKPIQMGLQFVKEVLGRGIFELELIYDHRVKDYVAIDLNPRAHGHISFDIARHNDLPLLWHRLATNQPLHIRPTLQNDLRWIHAIPFHVGQLIGVARGPKRRVRFTTYYKNLRGRTVDIINDSRDPLPSVGHAAYMLRHPGGLIKPFLGRSKT